MADLPIGAVVVWPSADPMPTGWHVCDGAGGTVDLRDRFVAGAGALYAVGDLGGNTGLGSVPSHDHTVAALTVRESSDNPNGYHRHLGTVQTDAASPAAGTAGAGLILVDAGVAATHAHDWTVTIPETSQHKHTVSGTTGAAAAEASSAGYPPWIALYYIQRLS